MFGENVWVLSWYKSFLITSDVAWEFLYWTCVKEICITWVLVIFVLIFFSLESWLKILLKGLKIHARTLRIELYPLQVGAVAGKMLTKLCCLICSFEILWTCDGNEFGYI